MTTFDFNARSVIVTGAGRGIGLGIADAFRLCGAQVLGCGRGERPDHLHADISWLTTDVSQLSDVEKLIDTAIELHDCLDILVNNAGMQIEKTITQTSDVDWDSLMSVNVKGVFLMCRSFVQHVSNGGNIINIGSVSAETADPGLAIYNASKSFVHGLTRSIAVDHGLQHIRCNAICPGWIRTGMVDAAFAAARDPQLAQRDAIARHPTGRMGLVADIASTAMWLASTESDFITGQCIKVDGGLMSASPIRPDLF